MVRVPKDTSHVLYGVILTVSFHAGAREPLNGDPKPTMYGHVFSPFNRNTLLTDAAGCTYRTSASGAVISWLVN